MEHLTREQMLAFVSMSRGTQTELEEAKKINAHLMTCSECRRRLAELQDAYDALRDGVSDGDGGADALG